MTLRTRLAALTFPLAALLPAMLNAQLPIPDDPSVNPALRFEVVSIKPFNDDLPTRVRIQPNARVDITGISVRLLMSNAFRVPGDQVIGLPDWTNADRYSILGQAPDGAKVTGIPTMLRNLLADRFNLVTHRETRERQTFDLVMADDNGKLGPALKPTSAECQAMIEAGTPAAAPRVGTDQAPCSTMQVAPGLVRAAGVPLARLVAMLSQLTDRPVDDRTGLYGLHDFTLTFNPNMNPDAAADADRPHLFTAVLEQLGLRLSSQRGSVQAVIVDRIEKPTVD